MIAVVRLASFLLFTTLLSVIVVEAHDHEHVTASGMDEDAILDMHRGLLSREDLDELKRHLRGYPAVHYDNHKDVDEEDKDEDQDSVGWHMREQQQEEDEEDRPPWWGPPPGRMGEGRRGYYYRGSNYNNDNDDNGDDYMMMRPGGMMMAQQQPEGEGGYGECPMRIIHYLFDHVDTIHRAVVETKYGAKSITSSTDLRVARALNEHVDTMKRMVEQYGHVPRQFDPLFRELAKEHSKITLTKTTLSDYAIQTELRGEDACSIAVARAHAQTVKKFVDNGWDEMHQQHPIPVECDVE